MDLVISSVERILINIEQLIQLSKRETVKVFMDKEKFNFMVSAWPLYWKDDQVQHCIVHFTWSEVHSVNEHCNLEWVALDAHNKQVKELLVRDVVLLGSDEFLNIVFFAVHLKHNVDVFRSHDELFSVVLSHPWFNFVVNYYFFVVCLIVLPVAVAQDIDSVWVTKQ